MCVVKMSGIYSRLFVIKSLLCKLVLSCRGCAGGERHRVTTAEICLQRKDMITKRYEITKRYDHETKAVQEESGTE